MRAPATDEACRLRVAQLEALVELLAWRSPSQLAMGVVAWARATGLSAERLDELAAAIRAAGKPTTEEAP